MMASVQYLDSFDVVAQEQICHLLDAAFSNAIYSANSRAGFFFAINPSCKYVVIRCNEKIAAIALVGWRTIDLLGGKMKAATIGPLAVHPAFQGKGVGALLMSSIEKLAKEEAIHILYLQGIEGFYSRYGYYPCLAKSKIIIESKRIPVSNDFELESVDLAHKDILSDMYASTARLTSCSAFRTDEEWTWLIKFARNTWYFYNPILVLTKGTPCGYFCSDPVQPNRIRESCYYPTQESVFNFLSGISLFCGQQGFDSFEVMTWYGSPLYECVKTSIDAEFVQYIRANASQLMKVLDYEAIEAGLINLLCEVVKAVNVTLHESFVCLVFTSGEDRRVVLNIPICFFSGFLSGYYEVNDAWIGVSECKKFEIAILRFFKELKKPFIFQGDNY